MTRTTRLLSVVGVAFISFVIAIATPAAEVPPATASTQSATIASHRAGVIARLARFHNLSARFTYQYKFHHDPDFKEIALRDGGVLRPAEDRGGEMHLYLLDGMGCWDTRWDAASAASMGIFRDVRVSNGQRIELFTERKKLSGMIMHDAGVAASLLEVGLGLRRNEPRAQARSAEKQ